MRVTVPPPPSEDDAARRATMSGVGYRDAESLFRSKPISDIRAAESTTRSHISQKQEELRLLVGTRYRDLIDSADSILRMKQSSRAISENLSSVQASIMAMSDRDAAASNPDRLATRSRSRIYGIASRVKYLVDTPENIWACLDESMFLEAASRFVRSKHLQLNQAEQDRFPLLQHHYQIVDGFKAQISQRARDRLFLFDGGSLPIESYADALAAISVVDDLPPARILSLFLDSRKAWVSHALTAETEDVVSVYCQALKVIQVTAAQVGELFLRVLNDMPLFYRVVLNSPPVSQLFGGIPDPEEEVKLWNQFREKLEFSMVSLERDYVSKLLGSWLRECGEEVVGRVNGRFLIDALGTGRQLAAAEAVIRETIESKEVLEKSLEWLRNVFGSNIESPWNCARELVLGDDYDLWEEIFEPTFVIRMKVIVDERFREMTTSVTTVERETAATAGSGGGGVWFVESSPKKVPGFSRGNSSEDYEFKTCLDAYLGTQIGTIRDSVDGCCQSIVEDLLCFLESPKASVRLQSLAPYLQSRCYDSLSNILKGLRDELGALESKTNPGAVERSLFIGRLLFAFLNHSKHVPVVLGPPRFWVKEAMSAVFDRLPSLMRRSAAESPTAAVLDSPGRRTPTSARRQTSLASAALLGAGEIASPQLEELTSTLRELCVRAHGLWISWLSNELSAVLSSDLERDDALSSTSPLRGWEETIVKQEQSDDSSAEMKILLPSMPSLYVVSFLFRACEEVHRIGGHVLDRTILQKFALSLLEKVISIYGDFISTREINGPQVSEKGVLQILLDLHLIADVLSGGDTVVNESLKIQRVKNPFRRKPEQNQTKSVVRTQVDGLISRLSQRLDPIDWLTYEPYLWENERQSYQRHAVLFGFFVQLNRMYTDAVQKLPTNSESNIMRCSSVPRFKYLPISAPVLSSRGTTKASLSLASEDISSRISWKAYTNGDISENIDVDDNSSFGVAAPFLKSFMQVGSKFGGSTLKLGSILTDGQVGIFKDRSSSAMSTFGDILPAHAAGLLSSFTASKSDS